MARTTQKTLLPIPFLLLRARIPGVAQKRVYMSQYYLISADPQTISILTELFFLFSLNERSRFCITSPPCRERTCTDFSCGDENIFMFFVLQAYIYKLHMFVFSDMYLVVRKLGVFENRVLRKIFVPKRDAVTGGWNKTA
jgi:hypothetical protein